MAGEQLRMIDDQVADEYVDKFVAQFADRLAACSDCDGKICLLPRELHSDFLCVDAGSFVHDLMAHGEMKDPLRRTYEFLSFVAGGHVVRRIRELLNVIGV